MACYMRMIFCDGFIHGDLHPGNILLRRRAPVGGSHLEDAGGGGGTAVGGSSGTAATPSDGGDTLDQRVAAGPRRLLARSPLPFEIVVLDAGLAIPLPPERVKALRSMAVA